MANGKQRAQQNIAAFEAWIATQSDDDFAETIFRGQLNRGEIAKAVGCGKSALTQNVELRTRLRKIEESLRAREILPPLTPSAEDSSDKPQAYDPTVRRQKLDSRRLTALEQENIELKAKVGVSELFIQILHDRPLCHAS